MQHGGSRQNAGRKVAKHTLLAQEMRRKLVEEIDKRLPDLLEAKFDLALGHQVQEQDEEGQERIYSKSPDGNAIRYLLDQGIGKAKESIELDNPQQNEQLAEINHKLKQMFTDARPRRLTKKNST